MALGSDSSKKVLVLMDMPFCGRPRKPRPLISIILIDYEDVLSNCAWSLVFIDDGTIFFSYGWMTIRASDVMKRRNAHLFRLVL
ncbi:hypothetical protein DID88_007265 [Monilinia fructigena]|uniref:Uncharacterized protein n=1 Tax=Monilinia fructigena TaxID=38457 RepID=A0A395J8S8_9HELO|nr:hypothetical protein DID88_007265 [Monilinia fructigena]